MTGFTGFIGSPPKGAGIQIFKTSGNFIVPEANFYLIDIFGGGGSGGATDYASNGIVYPGGGGGARNRQLFSKNICKPGLVLPVLIGSGGAPATSTTNINIVGANGGKSSVGSPVLGVFLEAYGGCGVGSNCNGGGGVFSSGTASGFGGNPCVAYSPAPGSGMVTSNVANACNDGGGASVVTFSGSFYLGGAIFGGGAAYSIGNSSGGSGGNSLYAGGGGASGNGWNAGFSGAFDSSGTTFSRSINGEIGKLIGGAGNGGQSNFSGSNSANSNGGFPSGGGGSVSVPGVPSGKGGDGLVVIYWW
ncbi:hypothetical protein [Undibacterium sp. TJN19]|uniref:hypothetical protein n=1 Tax=Undibacterium sp. TJN19 TaxID=3413055 RepID=UPI003BEF8AD3